MIQKNTIIACIDGSLSARAVCLSSSWLAQKLSYALTFVHVVEPEQITYPHDLSGSIGFNSKEQLLDELIELDTKRSKLLIQQGKHLLEAAKKIAIEQQVVAIDTIQVRGMLTTILNELPDIKIIVLGRQNEQYVADRFIGSQLSNQLENIIRLQKVPILINVNTFKEPKKIMFAYDGTETGKRILAQLASSQLLKDSECHVVLHGTDHNDLLTAKNLLAAHANNLKTELISGANISDSLCHYANDNNIDLIVMGAYGHKKWHDFFVGSNTTAMIMKTSIPLLMLR